MEVSTGETGEDKKPEIKCEPKEEKEATNDSSTNTESKKKSKNTHTHTSHTPSFSKHF